MSGSLSNESAVGRYATRVQFETCTTLQLPDMARVDEGGTTGQ